MSKYPCITLWEPWASWIAWGIKSIETRTHRRFANLNGRQIAIHAGQRWDPDWTTAMKWLTPEQITNTCALKKLGDRGIIVCTADVVDFAPLEEEHEPQALIECATPRWGLFLKNVRPTFPPMPKIRGAQGVFYISEESCA